MNRDIMYIHYWKINIPDEELQQWIDKMSLYSKKNWLILLEEKLRRIENEITIK